MDVINKISKVAGLPDAPVTNPREEFQVAHAFYVNGCVFDVRNTYAIKFSAI